MLTLSLVCTDNAFSALKISSKW